MVAQGRNAANGCEEGAGAMTIPRPGERWICKHPTRGHQAFTVARVDGADVVMASGGRYPLAEFQNAQDAYHLPRWERAK